MSTSTKTMLKHNVEEIIFVAAALMIAVTMLFFTTGCTQSPPQTSNEKPTVTVTTSFLQDMTDVLVGDKVNCLLIIPAGEDPHLYNPKPEDLDNIKAADLVLYHGLHFEGKMVEILEKTGKAVTRDFDKSDIGLFEEDGTMVDDPHFWFDIQLYKKAVKAASADLQELLPEDKETIQANEAAYLTKLDALDKENKEALNKIPRESRILVTPHDAFGYFARCYDMDVVAPQGVSTSSEVANSDMQKTVDTIVDNNIKAIFAESTTDPVRMKKLQELVEAKGGHVEVISGDKGELFSDSLAPKGQDGDTYLDMYRHNIKIIVENLA